MIGTDYLLDTNVLLRSADTTSAEHLPAQAAVNKLWAQGHELCYTAQNITEFWSVATRPQTSQNGLGLTAVDAAAEVSEIKAAFACLSENDEIFPEWERLVSAYSVLGKQLHDARLVAIMLTYRVTHILTFNTDHFAHYTQVVAVDPAAV